MVDRKADTEPPQFTRAGIERGITKLNRRIKDLKGLDPSEVHQYAPSVQVVESNIRAAIHDVFGKNSLESKLKGLSLILSPDGYNNKKSDAERREESSKILDRAVTILEGHILRLKEKREDLEADQGTEQSGTLSSDKSSTNSRRVFVVHGRDVAAKEEVRRLLTQLKLEPVILGEQPDQGQTVIEKFEGNADVGFAVVLLTPDDKGGLADSSNEPQRRARQNVIFELGFFVGKLGRKKVCTLYKGNVEIMSDYQGVIYVPMDDEGWRLNLAQEIKSAGINVDLNHLC